MVHRIEMNETVTSGTEAEATFYARCVNAATATLRQGGSSTAEATGTAVRIADAMLAERRRRDARETTARDSSRQNNRHRVD